MGKPSHNTIGRAGFRDMTELSCLLGFGSGVMNSNAFYGFGFMTTINRDKSSIRVILMAQGRAPTWQGIKCWEGRVLPKACGVLEHLLNSC